MEIIGLAGYATSGKDEAAKVLKMAGFRRVAFADKLREFVYAINPEVDGGPMGTLDLQQVIGRYGWNGYKDTYWGDSIREQLQYIGTECGRGILGQNVWIDATFNDMIENGKYVVTDVRFPNEIEGIRSRGGKMYRIIRDGVGPVNSHPSETAIDHYEYDGYIHNEGTLEEFHDTVRRAILENRS